MSNTVNPNARPDVLKTARDAREQLESDSRDLFVVNEVLKQEIPDSVKATGDIAAALERSESIQTDLDAVAENLGDVNQALAAEMTRRKSAEQTLVETRADLADTKADLADTKAQLADANDGA